MPVVHRTRGIDGCVNWYLGCLLDRADCAIAMWQGRGQEHPVQVRMGRRYLWIRTSTFMSL